MSSPSIDPDVTDPEPDDTGNLDRVLEDFNRTDVLQDGEFYQKPA